jgi:GNAT superfamily N-acetyltransferase
VSELEIRQTGYTAEPARTLVKEVLADLAVRYGNPTGDDTPVDPAQFDPPGGAFLVAWLDGAPAGCGGWRSLDGGDEIAEIKRMYVAPAARGRGVATALLRALEDSARRAGRKRMVLETGYRQPEAIALYGKAGYARIENFGYYRDEPGVRSFGRDL